MNKTGKKSPEEYTQQKLHIMLSFEKQGLGLFWGAEEKKQKEKKQHSWETGHKSVLFWQRVEEAWAITTGITVGAGMYWLTLAAAVILIIMIVVFYAKATTGQVYVAVIHYEGRDADDKIMQAFGKMKHFVKSKTMRAGTTELAVEVYVKKDDISFENDIRDIDGVKDVTLIQYNGEYNG